MSKKKKTTQKKVTVNKAQSQSQAKAVKPKKVKTTTEQPKPSIIKTLFSSLFNNNAVIIGGRFLAWWLAVILIVLSVGLAITPIMVSAGKVNGADILNSTQYGFDNGLLTFAEELDNKGVVLEVKVDHEYYDKDVYYMANTTNNFKEVFTNKVTITIDENNTEVDIHYYSAKNLEGKEQFRAYYVDSELTYDDLLTPKVDESLYSYSALAKYLNSISYDETKDDGGKTLPVNFMVFGIKNFYGSIYQPLSAFKEGEAKIMGNAPISSVTGIYSKKLLGMNISEFTKYIFNSGNETTPKTSIAGLGASASTRQIYLDGVTNNWKYLFNEGYQPIKSNNLWINFGVTILTNASIILLMGLVIFIITRGKHSINRDWTFWQSLKIASWAAFTPGLLALIIGFIMPSFAGMGFIMFYGTRIMWMSMKQLRPTYE